MSQAETTCCHMFNAQKHVNRRTIFSLMHNKEKPTGCIESKPSEYFVFKLYLKFVTLFCYQYL